MGANLKEVRGRITSVKSTMQITKAMKMVSASKLRRATDRIVQIRPYANQLNSVLANIVSNLQGDYNLELAQVRDVKKVLIVLVTSDKGLCGGFNANVLKLAKNLIKDKYADLENNNGIELLYIGKKGIEGFRTYKVDNNTSYVNTLGKLEFENSSLIAQDIITLFKKGTYDRVEVVYNMFKNAAVQIPTAEQFLPVQTNIQDENVSPSDYIFEPGKEEILETLVPNILKTQFFRFLLDSVASEHGARMTAMDKATDNANELLKELNIVYNRVRQAAITTELSEIVSGAAALSAE
ncbi:MAG: ATP synthase F1 subunit gamma [Chitinophagales bacterium]|nr:ATP synthase F1 subunit gamma [Chitinophagales bacterium]